MRVLIRGAGDIATGIALRLLRSGYEIVMTDLPQPTSIRRTVCFTEAIRLGTCRVEDVTARMISSPAEAETAIRRGEVPVLADPEARCREALKPGGAIALSFNTNTIRPQNIKDIMELSGLEVMRGGVYEGFSHWVEQAVTRDIAVAVRPIAM